MLPTCSPTVTEAHANGLEPHAHRNRLRIDIEDPLDP
jgi:hypothetical protein